MVSVFSVLLGCAVDPSGIVEEIDGGPLVDMWAPPDDGPMRDSFRGDGAECLDIDATCDGVDDDCDGSFDEDVPETCDGDGDGCADALASCEAGVLVCNDDPEREGDACDGDDADLVPEGSLQCRGNQLRCEGDCSVEVESCNARDDDCDGSVDEEGVCSDVGGDGVSCSLDAVRDGRAYLFCETMLAYPESVTACEARGYGTVAPEDAGEFDFIAGLTDSQNWRMGAETDATNAADRMDRSRWTWTATGATIDAGRWIPSEPNGSGSCGEIPQVTKTGMQDSNCDTARPFVCEASIVP